MAKKQGYKDYKKYRKSQGITTPPSAADYDFQAYAKEFEKLLNKKFWIKVNNGQVMEFYFKKGNFFHLLGFHKFEHTIFKKMIEDDTINYSASNFFEDVYNGYINYTSCDFDKINIPEDLKISDYELFDEHEKTSEITDVLMRRFPYFTYNHIVEILHNKVIIDFDRDSFSGDIRANKVLFCFLDVTQKNLNLFLDNKNNNYFVTSFFLENKKNYYKKKKDGSLMEELEVSGLYIKDTQDNTEYELRIYWDIITEYIISNYDITDYAEMKKMYNKKDITISYLNEQMVELGKKKLDVDNDIMVLEEKLKVIDLKKQYLSRDKENKDAIILQLMDYNIDVETILDDIETIKYEEKKKKIELQLLKDSEKRLNKKIRKTEMAIPQIQQMEILKVKEIYVPLIENSQCWKEEFWPYLIKESDCFKKEVFIKDVKDYYKAYKTSI